MKYYNSINEAVTDIYGDGTAAANRAPVAGGDINSAHALTLSDGRRLFMKSNRRENADFFRAEAEGLAAIRQTGTVLAPEVIAAGVDGTISFLLLEYIERGRGQLSAASSELGRKLAAMHLADTAPFVTGGRFGFSRDNYIGAGPQDNTPAGTWAEFFADRRLRPQFERAASYFDKDGRKRIDTFLGRISRYLPEPDRPSLLHGDLWAGNYMIDSKGRPWVIDPAAYVGHPEADLAMTELFGGFDRDFYAGYKEVAPVDPGYRDRRDLYNLYHLLNHLNLFGGGYLYSVTATLNRYV